MAYSAAQYLSLVNLSPDDCPEEYSLIWNESHKGCVVPCVYPFYEPWQDDFLFYFGTITSIISFLLCYFYCFTALFRPVMLEFPNSNVVFQFFCLGLSSAASLFPLILGKEYVYCDTMLTPGHTNWACVLSGSLLYFGLTSYTMWFLVFHITIVMRLYLVRLPKAVPYIFFFICFGTWPLVSVVSTTILEYWVYFPGNISCVPFYEPNFNYGMFTSIFYLICLITAILVFLIWVRLVKIKVSARVKWSIIFRKQARLLIYWALYGSFVIGFTIGMIENETQIDIPSSEEVAIGLREYTFCVLLSSQPDHCKLDQFVDFPRFYAVLPYLLILESYPIIMFLVFGTRLSLLRFWKEFFIYVWKKKRIPLPFVPSFDPTPSVVTEITSGVECTTFHPEAKTDANETDSDSSTDQEKELRKRINEI